MIPSFPFFRSPMFYNPFRNQYYYSQNNMNNNLGSHALSNNAYGNYNNCSYNKNYQHKVISNNDNFNSSNVNQQHEVDFQSDDDQYFDIFGIRLHFDDILILCLLFFLYQEGVNDQMLFIALLLILLS